MRFAQGMALIMCFGYLIGAVFLHMDITPGAVFLAAWLIMMDNEWLHKEKK